MALKVTSSWVEIKDGQGQVVDAGGIVSGLEKHGEVYHFISESSVPSDDNDGQLNGIRRHHAAKMTLPIGPASPIIADALNTGKTFKSVELKQYGTDDTGNQKLLKSTLLENIKFTYNKNELHHTKLADNDKRVGEQEVHFRFADLTETWQDGNLQAKDSWTAKRT